MKTVILTRPWDWRDGERLIAFDKGEATMIDRAAAEAEALGIIEGKANAPARPTRTTDAADKRG